MAVAEESTPEMVALRLFHFLCAAEKKSFEPKQGFAVPERKWILDTYAECLLTVQRPDSRKA